MTPSEPIVRLTSPPVAGKADGDVIDLFIPCASPVEDHAVVEITIAPGQMSLVPSSRGSSPGRIEDSVEALDQLEDDLEALHDASQVRKLNSTGETRQSPAVGGRLAKSGLSGTVTGVESKSASVRVKPTQSRPSLRRSASMNLREGDARTKPHVQGTAPANRKPAATRHLSVQDSPNSPATSAKPAKPTFELPGEAVARRLKEQRELRRSVQATPATPASAMPQRAKSLRAPTVARFELPGEAISRRKKEQHEKMLQKEAEEERKRREFKAAPVRSSATPANYPRETAASRARRVKASSEDSQDPVRPRQAAAEPVAAASKRTSVIGLSSRPSLRKSASNISNASTASTASRGRTTGTDESQSSRNTSASTGSAGTKRTPVPHEIVERQRLRGKELYDQDNSYVAVREQERRQRSMAAKAARDLAAEQGRQAGREFAARAEQQRRRISTATLGDKVAASM